MLSKICIVAFCAFFCNYAKGDGESIHGLSEGLFSGDFYPYVCKIRGDSNSKPNWWFQIGDHSELVTPSEIGEDEWLSEKGERRSFLRIPENLTAIACGGDESLSVHSFPFKQVQVLQEPHCGTTPKIILRRWGQSYDSQYWIPHHVTNGTVSLHRGYKGVSGLMLMCLSEERVQWKIRPIVDPALRREKMYTSGNCHVSSLVLSPLSDKSEQEYICQQNLYQSHVILKYYKGEFSPYNNLDFNRTQECVEELGTTIFGTGTLTWTTTGSSMVTVGTMIGMFMLKRQLSKQQGN